jgi:hypothetical protein
MKVQHRIIDITSLAEFFELKSERIGSFLFIAQKDASLALFYLQ